MIQQDFNHIIPISIHSGNGNGELDLEGISFFTAAGFFPENDTYWRQHKWKELDFTIQPWKYEPENITLNDAVEEFAELFHSIVEEQTNEGKVILPLSGGLDSRSLAVALKAIGKEPYTYSYRFQDSFNETKYGKKIADVLNWEFDEFIIPEGYLWNTIEKSAQIIHCYSEFTHSRQVAVAEQIATKGDVWLLGHWGDVLFDDMGVENELSFDQQIQVLTSKILKRGGKELANDLWNSWGLKDDFEHSLNERLKRMHGRIDIQQANARIRAFKSLYWATRWTSTNLQYFNHFKPMSLPYYDDRMCEFIMKVPEKWLAGRQIQIEYIKKYSPELAAIPWQSAAPYNLFNYHKHLTAAHLPYRIMNKGKYLAKRIVRGKPLVQRNWEIQFLGKENDAHLRQWLFDNPAFDKLVPKNIVEKYYHLFQTGDKVYWSHPLSMLLTLSVFAKTKLK